MPNNLWFQLLKCSNLLLYMVFCDSKLVVCRFERKKTFRNNELKHIGMFLNHTSSCFVDLHEGFF